jgi:hypothetical protein
MVSPSFYYFAELSNGKSIIATHYISWADIQHMYYKTMS